MDTEDLGTLGQMLALGADYISDQDETNDAADIARMQGVMADLAALTQSETAETEPAETDD